MNASEIRQRFLDFFESRSHTVRQSSNLVPVGDDTLLFTNAGMVQFKGIFLGSEESEMDRAVTSQKCLRAGGKHNDLEEVGRTARHHTFFEMLGNFSFGDYFKREAIELAWDFLTKELGMDPSRLFVTVHHTDDEAAELWPEVTGIGPERVYRLGDKDNFWQMADTGPCGPCSEIHYDMRPAQEWGQIPSTDEFEERGEAGEFLELWNLVFMQFDRDESGTLHDLPAPSIDTGLGLERLAAVLQGVNSNYHTDLFLPLLERVAQVLEREYAPDAPEGVGYRVLADHARAVTFLLSDGVFPSSEGRGYVLRRILRRAVRHAWLLGRREPTLCLVVEAVIEEMSGTFPELEDGRDRILKTTRAEEERFLTTIEGGMDRFDQLVEGDLADGTSRVIPGEEAFRLYDTFGFPLDLTELMAAERGFSVDGPGFEAALDEQRARSRADRAAAGGPDGGPDSLEDWRTLPDVRQRSAVHEATEVPTRVLGTREGDQEWGLLLADHPFYREGGGQISDQGTVQGEGWQLDVGRVAKVEDLMAVYGTPSEGFPGHSALGGSVRAQVTRGKRHDTERNHTGTHLLHAALRRVLGDHVVQRGSLVTPDRLRFDFSHSAPATSEEIAEIEGRVNQAIWADHPVETTVQSHEEAVAGGAMALFGEKYGDRVTVVEIPGVSIELCGGTHVRHTGEIGLFRILAESGVAAGVRRVEATTGPRAFELMSSYQGRLESLAGQLKVAPANLERRVDQLRSENEALEGLLSDLRKGGSSAGEEVIIEEEVEVGGRAATFRGVRLRARGPDDARAWGDNFLAAHEAGVALLAAEMPEDKHALFAFVSDSLIQVGIRADAVVREAATVVGGKGGGRPHLAQAGVADPTRVDEAVRAGADYVRSLAEGNGA